MIRHVGHLAARSAAALLRDVSVVFWNFGFFTILLLLFLGVLSGGDPAVRVTLTTSIVTLAVMANALFSIGVGLAAARERGVFRRLATTPIPIWAAVCGVAGGRVLLVASAALLQVLLARAVFGVSWSGGATSWIAIVASGTAAFVAIGALIAALAPAPHLANAMVNVILIPMTALGGTALPASMLPGPVAEFSRVLPVAAMVEGLTASFVAGAGVMDLIPNHLLLLGWTVAAGSIAAYAWRRRGV